MRDTISRQAAIDAIEHRLAEPAYQHTGEDWYVGMNCAESELYELPSAEPEIIRCKDCRWWDKYGDDIGYCMAAKHGYWSEHWEISIRRTYKGDFYCADARR